MSNRILITKMEMALILERLAAQILEKNPDPACLILVGIQRRGAHLATRLAKILEKTGGKAIPTGSININLYRDDWSDLSGKTPHIGKTDIPFSLNDKKILLVDDVLFSGRTIRAALEALFDFGRPAEVRLLALIDRGHRQLPICAQYVGRTIPSSLDEHIDVFVEEQDGKDEVVISTRTEA